ncbi:MAG: NINE protein [Saprospiraceae bacterium]|nr:NINE protein [Saprospiraceae bacterium]
MAAVLAFFLGTFGVHRFYLGQVVLGILYCLFMFTGISTVLGFIDAMVLLSSDEDKFDRKHNRKYFAIQEQEESFERNRRRRERDVEHWERRQRHQTPKVSLDKEREIERFKRVQRSKENMQRIATLREEGISFFKNYDYEAAIEAFKQVIALDEQDVATHFNLACAYSLEENSERSLYHLDRAIAFGFTDTTEKLKRMTH